MFTASRHVPLSYEMNPVHALPSYFNIILAHLGRQALTFSFSDQTSV